MCHEAGRRSRPPILLKYGEGDWNALHRDLYGELVFPLQVVINLNSPGVDHTGGEFLLFEQRPRAQSRGTATLHPARARAACSPPATDPSQSQRGWSAAPVRHGVSVIRSGERLTPRPRLPRRGVTRTGTHAPVGSEAKRYTLLGPDRRFYQSRTPGALGGTKASQSMGAWTVRRHGARSRAAGTSRAACSSPTRPPPSPPVTGRAARAAPRNTGRGKPRRRRKVARDVLTPSRRRAHRRVGWGV